MTALRPRALLPFVVALALLGAACGDDDDPVLGGDGADGGTGGGQVTVVGEDISFDPTELSATAGETLTITFDNRDEGVPHNFHVTGDGVDASTDITEGPVTQELEVTFEDPGDYEFRCDVHPGQMQGTISVE